MNKKSWNNAKIFALFFLILGVTSCPALDKPNTPSPPSKAPELIFETGTFKGEINYSWTALDFDNVYYTLVIMQGKHRTIEVLANGDAEASSTGAYSGTFKGELSEWYSAVVLAEFDTGEVYSTVKQARARGIEIDISGQTDRHVIIAKGTPNLYNGHPTTVMLDDNKTIFIVWSNGHGGTVEFLAKSEDAGLTWENLSVPSDWLTTRNCPSIYKLKDQDGKERLFVFAAHDNMPVTYSEDFGHTWTPVESLNKPCIMAFSSIIQLKNGNYLGLYHRGKKDQHEAQPFTVWSSKSEDGGITWSEPLLVGQREGRSPCEPCVIRSPDGNQLVCIMRENYRVGSSLIMFSDDEGETWSDIRETTWELTGDRHTAKYAPDGRLVIAFRDRMLESPYYGHFVIWVGRYEDILLNRRGQYRIKALHSYAGADCGYPGLEIFPDNTVLAATYIKYENNEDMHSIVSTRFNLDEIDIMALPDSKM